MDWHEPLITLDLAVCNHWQAVGWAQAQRHAPYADLAVTDEEVVTLYRFAVALEQKRRTRIATGMSGASGGTGSPGCPATEPLGSA